MGTAHPRPVAGAAGRLVGTLDACNCTGRHEQRAPTRAATGGKERQQADGLERRLQQNRCRFCVRLSDASCEPRTHSRSQRCTCRWRLVAGPGGGFIGPSRSGSSGCTRPTAPRPCYHVHDSGHAQATQAPAVGIQCGRRCARRACTIRRPRRLRASAVLPAVRCGGQPGCAVHWT